MVNAIFTLATSENYAKCAIVLAKTLRDTKTEAELYVLIPSNTAEYLSASILSCLQRSFDHVVPLTLQSSSSFSCRSELRVTLTKLHVFTFDTIQKGIFLDADTMVLSNIDHLFDLPSTFAACPEFAWPDCFNSGVFLFTPCQKTYSELSALAHSKPSFDGGDQDILNEYFKDTWTRLSVKYNLPVNKFKEMEYPENYGFPRAFVQFGKDIKLIHFIGGGINKPWSTGNVGESSQLKYFKNEWRKILDHQLLQEPPLKTPATVVEDEGVVEAVEELEKVDLDAPAQHAWAIKEESFDSIWEHISSKITS